MRRVPLVRAVTLVAGGAVMASRWPVRSQFLFSWDSANYALAMEHLDIATHRPHPPGYLGYVFAARALTLLVHDVNAALVLWNVIATVIAVALTLRFTADVLEDTPDPAMGLVGAAVAIVTSPLFWFYGAVAEIYPSELLVSLAVVYSGFRAMRGSARGMQACLALLGLAAVFKLSAAVLLIPYVVYAWYRSPVGARRSYLYMCLAVVAVVALIFFSSEPRILQIVWQQYTTSTAQSRVGAEHMVSPLRRFNRNVRDTFTAALAALGVVNVIVVVWWAAAVRRSGLGSSRMVLLWLGPWVGVLTLVHVGKPGYVLPLLPLAVLMVARAYATMARHVAVPLIVVMGLLNAAEFVLVQPLSDNVVANETSYREKTRLQKLASDLQALTFPTTATIRRSDRAVEALLEATRGCRGGRMLVVADFDPVDWRRVMWYVPGATAIQTLDSQVPFVANEHQARTIPDGGLTFESTCAGLWLGKPRNTSPDLLQSGARPLEGLGYRLPPGAVRVTRTRIEFPDSLRW